MTTRQVLTFASRAGGDGEGRAEGSAPAVPRFTPRRPPFDPSRYVVLSCPEKAARRYICTHHYSGSYPAAVVRAGMYEKTRGGGKLVGVAVYAVPMQNRAVPAWTGFDRTRGIELSRLHICDRVGFNAETWMLARAGRILTAIRPDIDVVVSYADPLARTTLDGRVVKRAHRGTIYRALANVHEVGRSSTRWHWLAPNGQFVSLRGLSKIRRRERGADGALRSLMGFGAPPPVPGEDWALYVKRALREGPFRRVFHPGNHVYVWAAHKRARRRVAAHAQALREK